MISTTFQGDNGAKATLTWGGRLYVLDVDDDHGLSYNLVLKENALGALREALEPGKKATKVISGEWFIEVNHFEDRTTLLVWRKESDPVVIPLLAEDSRKLREAFDVHYASFGADGPFRRCGASEGIAVPYVPEVTCPECKKTWSENT